MIFERIVIIAHYLLLLAILPVITAIFVNYPSSIMKYIYLGFLGLTLIIGLVKCAFIKFEKKGILILMPILLLYIYVVVMTILILFANMYQDEKQTILYTNIILIIFSELFLPQSHNGFFQIIKDVKYITVGQYINSNNFIGHFHSSVETPNVDGVFPDKISEISKTLSKPLFSEIRWKY